MFFGYKRNILLYVFPAQQQCARVKYKTFRNGELSMKKAAAVLLAVVMLLTTAPLSGFIGLELPGLFVSSSAAGIEDLEFSLSYTTGGYSVSCGNTPVTGELVIPSVFF